MRKSIFAAMLALMATMVGVTSCTKAGKGGADDGYLVTEYHLDIQPFEFAIYDFTVSYNEFASGGKVVEQKLTSPTWGYSGGNETKPEELILKIEGRLKPNAAEIVKQLVAKGETMNSGYSYECLACIYTDYKATSLKKTLIAESQSHKVPMAVDKMEAQLSKGVLMILDVRR